MSRTPKRHWKSYGTDPTADRRRSPGRAVRRVPELVHAHRVRTVRRDRVFSEVRSVRSNMLIRDIIARMRHGALTSRHSGRHLGRRLPLADWSREEVSFVVGDHDPCWHRCHPQWEDSIYIFIVTQRR
jgi:hypothetical protein